ncbi:MAG: response regulator [Woeseiaceae bacterium]
MSPVLSAETPLDDAAVMERIQRVLQSQDYSIVELRSFAAEAEAAMRARAQPRDPQLYANACLAVGRASYLADEVDRALAKLADCIADPENARAPTVFFRIKAFRAALLLAEDRPQESLTLLREIVSNPNLDVDPLERLRAKTYYAAALAENGQLLAARDQYQEAFSVSLDAGTDLLSMGIANNYIVALIDQGDFQTAADVLARVRPVTERAELGFVRSSLELHELQLMHRLGEPEQAIKFLKAYVTDRPADSPAFVGNAYEFMADAYRDLGKIKESIEAAEIAVEMLQALPLENFEARFSLAESLLLNNEPKKALAQLQAVSSASARTDLRTERWHQLSVRAYLELGDVAMARKRFQDLNETRASLARQSSEQSRQYYEAKLTTLRQQSEIDRIKEQSTALEARKDTLLQLANRSNQIRLLLIIGIVGLSLAGAAILYFHTQRRFERQLREKESELNESLSRQVEEKSAALVAQLGEQNRLERALARSAQTEAIGQLTGNVAHDFNNLMQIVRVANEQFATGELSSSQHAFLKGSNDALDHAASMIRQLLAFARRQTLEVRSMTFSDLLEDSLPLFETAVGRQIRLDVVDNSLDHAVRVDPSQLVTALLNLLANARDAMSDSGTIRLVSENYQVHAGDEWANVIPGDYILLGVQDQGAGMSGEIQDSAFEPFFTTKGDQAGTGLGLSSVKGFARQSGGDVRILASGADGTEIGLLLPCSEADGEEIVIEKPNTGRLDGLCILLVEDNPSLASTLEAMLRHLGAEVTHFQSADDAIEGLSGAGEYDAILSDIRMPGQHDGFGLHDWVAQHRPGLTVVLMTGFTDSNRQRDSVRMIHKPFSSEQLVHALTVEGQVNAS